MVYEDVTARNHCDVTHERIIDNNIPQAQRDARNLRMSILRSNRLQIRAPQAGYF